MHYLCSQTLRYLCIRQLTHRADSCDRAKHREQNAAWRLEDKEMCDVEEMMLDEEEEGSVHVVGSMHSDDRNLAPPSPKLFLQIFIRSSCYFVASSC